MENKIGKKLQSWIPQKVTPQPLSALDVPLAEEIAYADKKHKSVKRWKRFAVRPAFWSAVSVGADTAIFHNLDPKIALGLGGAYVATALARSFAAGKAEHAEDEALRRAQEHPESELSQKLFASHSRGRLKRVAGVGGAVGTFIGMVTVAVHATVVAPIALATYGVLRHEQHENRKQASRKARTVLERFASGR